MLEIPTLLKNIKIKKTMCPKAELLLINTNICSGAGGQVSADTDHRLIAGSGLQAAPVLLTGAEISLSSLVT